jgi:hypothetical protein
MNHLGPFNMRKMDGFNLRRFASCRARLGGLGKLGAAGGGGKDCFEQVATKQIMKLAVLPANPEWT